MVIGFVVVVGDVFDGGQGVVLWRGQGKVRRTSCEGGRVRQEGERVMVVVMVVVEVGHLSKYRATEQEEFRSCRHYA